MTKSTNATSQQALASRDARQQLNGHLSVVSRNTYQSGLGKCPLAHTVERKHHALGCRTFVLPGDKVHHSLCPEFEFSGADRKESIRPPEESAKLFAEAGTIARTAFFPPFQAYHGWIRRRFAPSVLLVGYCRCSIDICAGHHVKGINRKASAGQINLEECVVLVLCLLSKRDVLVRL